MPWNEPPNDYELQQALIAKRLQEIAELEVKETLRGGGPAADGGLQAERERLIARSNELIEQEKQRRGVRDASGA